MARLLFETPWWFPTILAALGVFLFWNGNRRGEAKVRNAGALFVLAAILVCALSYFVDTDRERAVKQSKQLVYSVQNQDWATMKSILDPTCSLWMLGDIPIYQNRNEIVSGAQHAVDKYGLKDLHVLSASGEQTDTEIRVTLSVVSTHDFTQGRPITSEWLMDWQQMGKKWSLVRITCVRIANLEGGAAAQQFVRP